MKSIKANKIPDKIPVEPTDKASVWFEDTCEMMIQMELEFPEVLSSGRLENATRLSLNMEPVLGCRFVHHWRKPYWQRVDANRNQLFLLASTPEEYYAFSKEIINAYTGPQIRVCLFNDTKCSKMIIKSSHHVADAAGVIDIVKTLAFIYPRLNNDPDFKPEPNLTRYGITRNLIKNIPLKERIRLRKKYATYLKSVQESGPVFSLPFDEGSSDTITCLHRSIDSNRFLRLKEYGHSHDASINDILISAFFHAQTEAGKWDGTKNLRINSTINLRRHLPEKKASAVTNLSMSFPSWPDLGRELGSNLIETVKRVRNQTRSQKDDLFGLAPFIYAYPALSHIPHSISLKLIKHLLHRGNANGEADTFSNIGAIDPAGMSFEIKPSAVRFMPPPMHSPAFLLTASGYENTLTLSTSVYKIQKDLTESFLDTMVSELKTISD